MASITELGLFKQCVEDPKHISLDDLNLEKIEDPRDKEGLTH